MYIEHSEDDERSEYTEYTFLRAKMGYTTSREVNPLVVQTLTRVVFLQNIVAFGAVDLKRLRELNFVCKAWNDTVRNFSYDTWKRCLQSLPFGCPGYSATGHFILLQDVVDGSRSGCKYDLQYSLTDDKMEWNEFVVFCITRKWEYVERIVNAGLYTGRFPLEIFLSGTTAMVDFFLNKGYRWRKEDENGIAVAVAERCNRGMFRKLKEIGFVISQDLLQCIVPRIIKSKGLQFDARAENFLQFLIVGCNLDLYDNYPSVCFENSQMKSMPCSILRHFAEKSMTPPLWLMRAVIKNVLSEGDDSLIRYLYIYGQRLQWYGAVPLEQLGVLQTWVLIEVIDYELAIYNRVIHDPNVPTSMTLYDNFVQIRKILANIIWRQ